MNDQIGLEAFMRAAINAGRRALPDCLPNPPVGCVLVSAGTIIASGYTQKPGAHHAEAMALSQIRTARLPTVDVYVTLEPCAFHGRTPSCTDALIARGVGRVFVAMIDPDPRNNGTGIERLRAAGIRVTVGLLGADVDTDLRPYLFRTLSDK